MLVLTIFFASFSAHGADEVDEILKGPAIWKLKKKELFPDSDARDLAIAAAEGNLDRVQKLVAAGVSIDQPGLYGVTPIVASIFKSNFEGFKFLIQLGAKVDVHYVDQATGYDYGCLIGFAAYHKDIRFLKLLLELGADPDLRCDSDKRSALHRVLDGKKASRIKRDLLYQAGADINSIAHSFTYKQSGDTVTPLIRAIQRLHFSTAIELLERGANPAVKQVDGRYTLNIIDQHFKRVILKGSRAETEWELTKKWIVENRADLKHIFEE